MKWREEIANGFEERMKNIAAFMPLFKLESGNKYRYDLVALGVALK
ncbi:hypothetical protein M1M92_02060 [Peptococcaceae bacterium]|nr:hypothetical protein [Peptococcaceae bacterium]